MTTEIVDLIESKISETQWSPEQVSGWLKKEQVIEVSHESIYRHVWADKRAGGTLYTHLRHRGKKYNRRGAIYAGRGCIPGRIDIDARPKVVEEKSRVGDWELDTIVGKGNSGVIVSMVERGSKYIKLARAENRGSETVSQALRDKLSPLQDLVITMTADNGKEFSSHVEVSNALKAQMYFAKPYHSWERGLSEHSNGLVRQYFSKSTRFDNITDEEVQRIEDLLNSRPRKVLGFRTPLEVFEEARSSTAVALHC